MLVSLHLEVRARDIALPPCTVASHLISHHADLVRPPHCGGLLGAALLSCPDDIN